MIIRRNGYDKKEKRAKGAFLLVLYLPMDIVGISNWAQHAKEMLACIEASARGMQLRV